VHALIRALRAGLIRATASQAPLARIMRNTFWLLAAKGLGAVLSLVYLALLTRSLGPRGFGTFTLILGIGQAVATLLAFQSWRIVLRFGTPALLAGRIAQVHRLIWFCALIDLVAAVAGCVAAVALVLLLAPHFGWARPTARHAMYFAFVLLLTVRSTAVGALRLYDRFRDGAAADATTPIMRMLGAGAVMLAGPDVNLFLLAWAVTEFVTAAAYWAFVWRRIRPSASGWRHILRVPGEHAGFWRFALFSNVNTSLATSGPQIALLAVGYVTGAADAGFFRLAYQLGQALLTLAEMLSRALYAELARVQASSSLAVMRRLLARTNRAALVAGVLVVVLVVVAGRPALVLIGGAAYGAAFALLALLGTAAAAQLIGVSFEPALMSLNRTGLLVSIRLGVMAGLLGLLAVLLPRFGAMGAAAAMLAAALAGMAMTGLAARRAAGGTAPT
jgi:O-antigen/teichoic acid export membrane protein